jgi:benzil reductase ((S)-benzoin forming)
MATGRDDRDEDDRTSGTLEPAAVAGRVAVVTGASRGLGAGLARRFVARGVHVGMCARTEPEPPRPDAGPDRPGAEATPPHVADPGGTVSGEAPTPAVSVVTASVDVRDADAVERFCARVADRLGPIDLWINNAGLLGPIAQLRDADPAELADTIEVNVVGVLLGCRAYARHVRSRGGGGVLVNVTSGAATKPYVGWSAYCASKAAVDHLSRVVALEEAGTGLRVHAVSPGLVDTDMQALIRSTPPDRFPELPRFRQAAASGGFNRPAWVADRILDLAFGPLGDALPQIWRVPDEPRRR